MDILGPLTKTTEGHKYILLVVDSFSKWPEAFPLRTQKSSEIAKVLFREICCQYGAPYTIVSPYQILNGKEMYIPFDTLLIPKDGMNQDARPLSQTC